MNKTRVLHFYPGDNVHINITANFKKFTIMKIEVFEIDEPFNDDINIEL